MSDQADIAESVRIAHLTMLQGVITRMGSNSFTLKALSATFGSASVAIIATAEEPALSYGLAALIPIVLFWLMDAQYLKLERAYRTLYDRVRMGEEVEMYSLDASPFVGDVGPILKLAFTWSVGWFYFAMIAAFTMLSFTIFDGFKWLACLIS